jgi:dihydropteroate synthase
MSASVWRAGRFALDLARPQVMGIVNATPDSFADAGVAETADRAIARCAQLVAEGADILDIGGESTRPGAMPVSAETELARIAPIVAVALTMGRAVSVDTSKPEVMRAVLELGADIVNDVSALRAPGALELVAAHGACGVCLMHRRGTPQTMQTERAYVDVVAEVGDFLRERIAAAARAGIVRDRLVVDPGIGFAKGAAENLAILARQRELLGLGVPLLVGWSRKATLARLAGLAGGSAAERTADERERLAVASSVAAVLAVERGASIVRVHDVASTVAALAVWRAASPAGSGTPDGAGIAPPDAASLGR